MTERIKELAEQAGYLSDGFGFGHWDMPECKKFAELIVRECAEIALRENHDPYECILKHFGLETVNDTLRRRSSYYGHNP